MQGTHPIKKSRVASIFGRLMETGNGALSPDLARFFLNLHFSEQDKDRMHELAVKNKEGAITSEEIFSTLMGEQVEPRRAFIESNALGVRNLDV